MYKRSGNCWSSCTSNSSKYANSFKNPPEVSDSAFHNIPCSSFLITTVSCITGLLSRNGRIAALLTGLGFLMADGEDLGFEGGGFPVRLCTRSRKFWTSVLMISGANMWIIRIFGLSLKMVRESLRRVRVDMLLELAIQRRRREYWRNGWCVILLQGREEE